MAEDQVTENSPLNTAVKSVINTDREQSDDYYKGAIRLQKTLDDLTAAYQRRVNPTEEKNLFDPMWLKIAAGFLAPTKTGGFGESAGYAATGAGEEMERQAKLKKERELQQIQDLESQFKIAQAQQGLTKEGMQHEFISKYGEPNDVRQVAVTLPDGTQSIKEEKFFNPDKALKDAVKSGAIGYDKYLELLSKEKTGKMLTDEEAKAVGLDTSGGRKWNRTNTGTYEIVSGTKPPEASPFRIGDTRTVEKNRVKYTEEYQGAEKGWVNIGKSAADKPEKTSTLSNDAIDVGAYTYKLTGKMPPIGRGKEDYDAMLERYAMIANGAYSNPNAEKAAKDTLTGRQDFAVSQKALQNFATGKQGDSVRFIGVGLNHMDTLDKAIDALDNFDIKMANRLVNPFKVELGGDAVTNFNAIKGIVSDEIVKAIIGSAGALADRQDIKQQLSDASSLEQLKGALGKYKELFAGQLGGLKQQYESSTGRTDFDKKLTPEVASLLSTLNKGSASSTPQKPAVSADDEALINKHLNKGKAK